MMARERDESLNKEEIGVGKSVAIDNVSLDGVVLDPAGDECFSSGG